MHSKQQLSDKARKLGSLGGRPRKHPMPQGNVQRTALNAVPKSKHITELSVVPNRNHLSTRTHDASSLYANDYLRSF